MSDRMQELAVFARAAESGSFSRAARELGLSQPSVSRIIGELEARLGVTLLLRTRAGSRSPMPARCFSIAPARSSPKSRTPKTPRAASILCAAPSGSPYP
jgi:DNA-binding transcriptional LysR family regulator